MDENLKRILKALGSEEFEKITNTKKEARTIEYKWNPGNRFLTVSVSNRTRIKDRTVAYGSRVVNTLL